MKLTLDKISPATSKTGKSFWWVEAGANKYSLWDAEIAGKLAAGQTYDLEVETHGSFNNIKGLLEPETHESIGKDFDKSASEVAKPDWDKIAEGKVRHGIAVAFIEQGAELNDETKKQMNGWVEFVMNG